MVLKRYSAAVSCLAFIFVPIDILHLRGKNWKTYTIALVLFVYSEIKAWYVKTIRTIGQ